ncbi:MAG: helix-turn-helix transcriptional regulator [Thermodesulfovibrionales bacterium]|nr:helix-turn-helix domain-containing protein [Nitrospinota bacterium]MDP3049515.1 helix-turn-helix transcriptional regulator [Thermodesulfovibrionales bacterium]
MDKKYIGDLIRLARKTAGLSQMELAERVGISYQQIQKYEKGISEISIARLSQIADALNTPLGSFIAEDEKTMVSESISKYGAVRDDEIELLRLFRKIKSKKLKNGLLVMIKSIAELSENKDAKKKPKALAS